MERRPHRAGSAQQQDGGAGGLPAHGPLPSQKPGPVKGAVRAAQLGETPLGLSRVSSYGSSLMVAPWDRPRVSLSWEPLPSYAQKEGGQT